MIELQKVKVDELETVHDMQIRAFASLLEKYQDYDGNPGAESLERIQKRFNAPNRNYFFIVDDDVKVGVIQVWIREDGWKKIAPIFVNPDFQNCGYAQKAMLLAEDLFGKENWCLDTVKEEKKLCHLYEKMGYKLTGHEEAVSDIETLVEYKKS
ncbi:MAG: GNAT family N-acetyltransferase [Treponema sp.]|nr:GNAT family N-acetyltransferase [Treponema sp.]